MILHCTNFTDVMDELPLTRGVPIPYTRYCEVEVASAISLHYAVGQSDIAWKVETQNLMKGNGKHGYTI
jgi:hypothetical protein